jgi:hypothetical protein
MLLVEEAPVVASLTNVPPQKVHTAKATSDEVSQFPKKCDYRLEPQPESELSPLLTDMMPKEVDQVSAMFSPIKVGELVPEFQSVAIAHLDEAPGTPLSPVPIEELAGPEGEPSPNIAHVFPDGGPEVEPSPGLADVFPRVFAADGPEAEPSPGLTDRIPDHEGPQSCSDTSDSEAESECMQRGTIFGNLDSSLRFLREAGLRKPDLSEPPEVSGYEPPQTRSRNPVPPINLAPLKQVRFSADVEVIERSPVEDTSFEKPRGPFKFIRIPSPRPSTEHMDGGSEDEDSDDVPSLERRSSPAESQSHAENPQPSELFSATLQLAAGRSPPLRVADEQALMNAVQAEDSGDELDAPVEHAFAAVWGAACGKEIAKSISLPTSSFAEAELIPPIALSDRCCHRGQDRSVSPVSIKAPSMQVTPEIPAKLPTLKTSEARDISPVLVTPRNVVVAPSVRSEVVHSPIALGSSSSSYQDFVPRVEKDDMRRSVSPIRIPPRQLLTPRGIDGRRTSSEPKSDLSSPPPPEIAEIAFPRPIGLAKSPNLRRPLAEVEDVDTEIGRSGSAQAELIPAPWASLQVKPAQELCPSPGKKAAFALQVKPAQELWASPGKQPRNWPRLLPHPDSPSIKEAVEADVSAKQAFRTLMENYEQHLDLLDAAIEAHSRDTSGKASMHWILERYIELCTFFRTVDKKDWEALHTGHLKNWPPERRESLKGKCARLGLNGAAQRSTRKEVPVKDDHLIAGVTDHDSTGGALDDTIKRTPRPNVSDGLAETLNATWNAMHLSWSRKQSW